MSTSVLPMTVWGILPVHSSRTAFHPCPNSLLSGASPSSDTLAFAVRDRGGSRRAAEHSRIPVVHFPSPVGAAVGQPITNRALSQVSRYKRALGFTVETIPCHRFNRGNIRLGSPPDKQASGNIRSVARS